MPSANDYELGLDPSSILENARRVNKAFEDMGKGFEGAAGRGEKAMQQLTDKLLVFSKASDRNLQRQIEGLSKSAELAGKSGIERLTIQQDQYIRRIEKSTLSLELQRKAIDQVKEATQRLIRAEQEGGGGGHGTGTPGFLAFRGARDIFEGRTTYGIVQLQRALTSLSGAPLVLGSIGAGLAAVELLSHKAAASVAEYARTIHNLSLQTGLSTTEVQRFAFAAKASGTDIEILQRVTRGLTQAIEDESTKGQKGREILQSMGVDLLALRSGALPTIDLFRTIATSIEKNENVWLRNKDAIDLFKRAGIQSLPMMTELNKLLQESERIKFMSPDQIARFKEVHEEITGLRTVWEQLMLQIKADTAKPYIITVRFLREGLARGGALNPYATGAEQQQAMDDLMFGNLRRMTTDRAREQAQQRPPLEVASRTFYIQRQISTDVEAAESEASRLRKIYDETRNDVTKTATEIERTRLAYIRQRDVAKNLSEIESDRRANLEAIRKMHQDIGERLQYPYGRLPSVTQRDRELERRNLLPAQVTEIERAYQPVIRQEIQERLRRGGLTLGVAGITRAPVNTETEIKLDERAGHAREEQLQRELRLVTEITKQRDHDLREQIRFGEQSYQVSLRSQTAGEEAAVRLRQTLAPDTITERLRADTELRDIRIRNIDELYRHEQENIRSEYENAETRDIALTDARIKRNAEVADANRQLAQSVAQEQRRQLDEVAHAAEGLFHTLFTQPSKFGAQLATTLRDATLKPIEQGLGQLVSRGLYGTIFGATGTGGIAGTLRGLFGGRTVGPIGTTADPVAVTIVGGGGGGGIVSTGGGGSGGGLPFGAPGIPWGILSNPVGGPGDTSSISGVGAVVGGPGGTSGFTGRVRSFGSTVLSNLRSLNWANLGRAGIATGGSMLLSSGLSDQRNTVTGDLSTIGGAAASGFTYGGPIGGAIGAGIGTMISGFRNRGTTRGTVEQILGDPTGTGLFALATHLFGGESDLIHTRNLVASTYRISINDRTALDIMKLAKDQYHGSINLAVRSPEVRQMLGVYAAGTGQFGSFPQSAQLPHGGSLTEFGGSLYQSPTYQFGHPFAYQSNLPIYGGGGGVSLLPGGGGGGGSTYLSLHIDGDSAGKFMDGKYVSPESVAMKFGSAMSSSAGRLSNAITLSEPGASVY